MKAIVSVIDRPSFKKTAASSSLFICLSMGYCKRKRATLSPVCCVDGAVILAISTFLAYGSLVAFSCAFLITISMINKIFVAVGRAGVRASVETESAVNII